MSKALLPIACLSAIFGHVTCATADVILTPGIVVEASYDLDTQFPGNPVDQFGASIEFGGPGMPAGASFEYQLFDSAGGAVGSAQTVTNTLGSPLRGRTLAAFSTPPADGYILFSDPSASIDIATVSLVPLSFNGVEYLNPDGSAVSISTTLSAGAVPEPATWAMMGLGFAALGFVGYRASGKRAAAPA
jgi:PEP-CTERM motif